MDKERAKAEALEAYDPTPVKGVFRGGKVIPWQQADTDGPAGRATIRQRPDPLEAKMRALAATDTEVVRRRTPQERLKALTDQLVAGTPRSGDGTFNPPRSVMRRIERLFHKQGFVVQREHLEAYAQLILEEAEARMRLNPLQQRRA